MDYFHLINSLSATALSELRGSKLLSSNFLASMQRPQTFHKHKTRFWVDSITYKECGYLRHSDSSQNTSVSIQWLTNSPHCFSRSVPSMCNPLFILMFMVFLLSCVWSIKHPCVLAPSPLQPTILFLKPNCEPMLSWWNSRDWWPFQKLLQFRPSLACVSVVSNLASKSLHLPLVERSDPEILSRLSFKRCLFILCPSSERKFFYPSIHHLLSKTVLIPAAKCKE